MMSRIYIRIATVITLIGMMGIAVRSGAREDLVTTHHRAHLKTTAAGCQPATAAIDLDINNIRARLMTGGDMWWNLGTQVAAYEIPKGSGKSSQFAASCWIGGFDQQGQLKVAGQTYRQNGNDYWPGALNANGKITSDTCNLWDRFWKIDKATITQFIANYKSGGDNSASKFDPIYQWPANGNSSTKQNRGVIGSDGVTKLYLNPNFTYAPFEDLNGNGKYEPEQGEYPKITGDEYIWWVFNDAGNVKQMSLTAAMGIEVQTSAFAYATQDFLNNSTFCNYRVINRGALTIDSTYIAVWDDCDLGYYLDDFIGCDTSRGLGIQYNGTNDDGGGAGHPVNSYGINPPQVGLDFFQGPKRTVTVHRAGLPDTVQIQQLGMTNFTYFNNDASVIGNPNNGIQMYNYMTGTIINGEHFSYDYQGAGIPSVGYGSGPSTNFVFWGDAGDRSGWSECACNNTTGDRRFIFSSGPFELVPGAINDITFGCVWAPQPAGGCGRTNFNLIRNIDDGAQALFDNHFKTVEGPEAPRMEVRALDRRLVFYLVNDFGSNNYGENYGRATGTYKDSLQYHQAVVKANGKPDSLYHFEGYRVFQLANSQVSAADIFNQTTGEVDGTKAVEVFQCDVHNGVSQAVNYVVDLAVSATTYVPQIKVIGKDSGIVHSFELTQDQFATGSDKSLVNYHNYYFVAIAYGYNNFAPFDPTNPTFTQDAAYIGSAHSAGGANVKVVTALPNPANGDMGTVINSDYGQGVVITRVEGTGNGGNFVQLNAASEDAVMLNNSIDTATYTPGEGPINVKVVDPVRVPKYNWVLQLNGGNSAARGIDTTGTWTLTGIDENGITQTIYSEQDISAINEQIVEKYGISVSVRQVKAPGYDQANGNGYIASDITFEDPSKPWLFGVADQSDSSFANWLRVGNTQIYTHQTPCQFNDYKVDTLAAYQNMFANFSPTTSTWGPYAAAAGFYYGGYTGTGAVCGFEVGAARLSADSAIALMHRLSDVNLVFTKETSKWTRCAVIEQQEDKVLSEGSANKFFIRNHAGWNGDFAADGRSPKYSENAADAGMSWFPGYAIDQVTGRRLNIVFGEDSYLSSDNGSDMIWNPTSTIFSNFNNTVLFGGKHIVYILRSTYDSDKVFMNTVKLASPNNLIPLKNAYSACEWVGVPVLNPELNLLPLNQGLIPNKTTLRFRVNVPYAPYAAVNPAIVSPVPVTPATPYNPYYTFSTNDYAPTALSDNSNRDVLLDRIYAVPNPYYGYSGYEQNRFDTKVRIINLPAKATIYIYSLDGSLIRTLTKNEPNTSYIDWDIRNSAGLPISSGMYLMDVKADGIGETVIRWFGSSRPIDVTNY